MFLSQLCIGPVPHINGKPLSLIHISDETLEETLARHRKLLAEYMVRNNISVLPEDVYEAVSYTHLDVYKRQPVNR